MRENSDAMYLAGIVADGSRMTQTQLNRWAKAASWYMLGEYTVPGVAAQHKAACKLGFYGLIQKKNPSHRQAGQPCRFT